MGKKLSLVLREKDAMRGAEAAVGERTVSPFDLVTIIERSNKACERAEQQAT